jgi:hypothetical protein
VAGLDELCRRAARLGEARRPEPLVHAYPFHGVIVP